MPVFFAYRDKKPPTPMLTNSTGLNFFFFFFKGGLNYLSKGQNPW